MIEIDSDESDDGIEILYEIFPQKPTTSTSQKAGPASKSRILKSQKAVSMSTSKNKILEDRRRRACCICNIPLAPTIRLVDHCLQRHSHSPFVVLHKVKLNGIKPVNVHGSYDTRLFTQESRKNLSLKRESSNSGNNVALFRNQTLVNGTTQSKALKKLHPPRGGTTGYKNLEAKTLRSDVPEKKRRLESSSKSMIGGGNSSKSLNTSERGQVQPLKSAFGHQINDAADVFQIQKVSGSDGQVLIFPNQKVPTTKSFVREGAPKVNSLKAEVKESCKKCPNPCCNRNDVSELHRKLCETLKCSKFGLRCDHISNLEEIDTFLEHINMAHPGVRAIAGVEIQDIKRQLPSVQNEKCDKDKEMKKEKQKEKEEEKRKEKEEEKRKEKEEENQKVKDKENETKKQQAMEVEKEVPKKKRQEQDSIVYSCSHPGCSYTTLNKWHFQVHVKRKKMHETMKKSGAFAPLLAKPVIEKAVDTSGNLIRSFAFNVAKSRQHKKNDLLRNKLHVIKQESSTSSSSTEATQNHSKYEPVVDQPVEPYVRGYVCSFCDTRFGSYPDKVNHVLKYHTGSNDLYSPQFHDNIDCRSSHCQPDELSEEEATRICKKCHAMCESVEALALHMKRHSNKGLPLPAR